MSRFWPVAEAAQADYESLREAVLAGTRPLGPAALRFEAAGLWGLLRRNGRASYGARLFGAPRPAWSPYDDPRLEVLADAYLLVLGARGAVYARVDQAQEARGTIGSQLQALREHVTAEGHQPAGEFVDDGYSGARLDRPGLDALRDTAEAGLVDVVLCLTPTASAAPTPTRCSSPTSSPVMGPPCATSTRRHRLGPPSAAFDPGPIGHSRVRDRSARTQKTFGRSSPTRVTQSRLLLTS